MQKKKAEGNQREELVEEMINVSLFGEKGLCGYEEEDEILDCRVGP